MSSTAPPIDPDVPPLPPAEEFWTKYNNRLEFPFSTVGAVLLHVVVAVAVVLMLTRMKADAPDRSDLRMTITVIDNLPSEGAPGFGPEEPDRPVPEPKIEPLPIPPADLPKLLEVRKTIEAALPDPTGTPIPDHKAAEFVDIDKKLAQALVRGAGPRGPGPDGVGKDSVVAQSFRWTLRFRTRDGRDYLYQLGALRAQILVPLPPDNARCLLFEDLTADPPRGRIATDEDIQRLAGQVRFSDRSRDSVRQVAGALGLDQTPAVFYAFFPTDLTKDWAAKERAFRGANPKDIEETVLLVTVAGGRPEVRVTDQRLRKK
jgi:hypothetical protein